MLPKHVAVVLIDRAHEMHEAVGFVTGVRGEPSRAGRPVGTDESEVTFVNPETGEQSIHIVQNDALAVNGC